MTNKKFAQDVTKETARTEQHVSAIPTNITLEEASHSNPFHTETMHIFGYEHLDLVENCSFSETIYLLFRGELPNPSEKALFDKFLSCLINPGPRHPACRAAMNAGVARTAIHHILPIGLSVASGKYIGSEDVFHAMHFMRENVGKDPAEVAQSRIKNTSFDRESDPKVAPGFGSYFGGIDTYTLKLADFIAQHNEEGKHFRFCRELVSNWQVYEAGWLVSGLAAAVFCDLGFHPRQGPALFQIAIAPGLAAHGIEKANRPLTDMPFVSDENYHIEPDALCQSSFEGK